MARSQNATFIGDEPEAIRERVRGATLANLLSNSLTEFGWFPEKIHDWRDAGYLIPLARNDALLDVVLTQYHGDVRRWILQIAASKYPGLVLRIFGATPSATATDIYEVASQIHCVLKDRGFTDFRWCWDEFADGDHCTCEPSSAD